MGGGIEVFSYTADAETLTHRPADAEDVELQRFAVPRNKNTSRYAKFYTAEGLLREQHHREMILRNHLPPTNSLYLGLV